MSFSTKNKLFVVQSLPGFHHTFTFLVRLPTTRYQLSREVGKGHLLLIALESASKKVEGDEREKSWAYSSLLDEFDLIKRQNS